MSGALPAGQGNAEIGRRASSLKESGNPRAVHPARRRPPDRRRQLLAIAGQLFAQAGYEATSMRDIAAAAGMTPAALYHHFPSKERLFIAVEEASIAKILHHVQAAIADVDDPRARFRAALVAQVEATLDKEGFPVLVAFTFPPAISAEGRVVLARQRRDYEEMMAGLIADLSLPPSIDPLIFRKHVLGALNWTALWYREDGPLGPAGIAGQLAEMVGC